MEKRKIFKGLYKDKSFIKMICFTIVLILVLILGNTFGYVSADEISSEFDTYLNVADYNNSDIYTSNINWTPHFVSSANDSNQKTAFSSLRDIDFTSVSDVPSDFDFSDIKNYLVVGKPFPNSGVTLYLFPQEEIYLAFGNVGRFYLYTPEDNSTYYTLTIYSYSDGTTLDHLTLDANEWDDVQPIINSFSLTYDNGMTMYSNNWIANNDNYPLLCTFPIITTLQGYTNVSFDFGMVYKDFILNNNDTYVTNTNYMIGYNPSLNGFDNLLGVSNDSIENNDPNASNYMYADYADWYLNNYTGDIANRYRTVSAVFTSNLNDYINDSLVLGDSSTDSPYTIDFDFTCFVDFYYSYITDSSDTSISLGNNFISGSIGSSSSVLNKTYYWAASYEAPDTMGNYLVGMHIDASTFADNNYIQEWPLSGLFAYMEPTDSYVVSENGQKNNISLSLQSLMTLISNGVIYNSSNEHVELSNFRLTCTATIQYGDAFDDVFGDIYRSGTYSETFDLLTGESSLNSDSMLTNYNPYVENTDTDYSQLPSTETGTNSNSTTVTTGNVTQTVTVTNEGASYIPSLISKLLPTSLGDTGTGLVDTFSTMAQTNGWISVMASTVPAIPGTVWNYITDYLGISLYLLACAFVLRLILDLL